MWSLSPLSKRRISYLKQNKRGYFSCKVIAVIFIICCFADFIANDKPLVIYYNNQILFPIITTYSEKYFSGDFETEAQYKDTYVQELIAKKGWMIWPLIPFSYDTIIYDLPEPAPTPPSKINLLGTDDLGRDVLARLIHGLRISLFFGLLLTILSSFFGIIAGAIQGYYGGKIDLFFQRFIEVWSGLPVIFILIIFASIVQPDFWWLLGIMVIFNWTSLVGVVRAEFLRTRNFDFVKAAKALGTSNPRIMYRHILPNAMITTLTYVPFIMNHSIITLTSLDFLGFGLPPGSASLGEMLKQGKNNLFAPWLGLTAFFSIAILLSLLIFMGEAIRDAFDPRKDLR